MDSPIIRYRLTGDDQWFYLVPNFRNFIEASATLLKLLADPTVVDIRYDEARLAPGDMRRLDWERFKELCLDYIEERRG